ncbi:MAG: hypothetical protein ABR543_01575 [Gemmatimonadaceae bacterium]
MLRSRLFKVLVSIAVLAAGISCSTWDSAPTEVQPRHPQPPEAQVAGDDLDDDQEPDLVSAVTGLLSCQAQPYLRVEKVIGPAGGTLVIGKHQLVVPPGALESRVRIRAERPSDRVVSVRLHPEGLEFDDDNPARLTLDYNHCALGHNLIPKRIAYTTERLRIISLLKSVDNLLRRRVSAELEHFSRYAVAY